MAPRGSAGGGLGFGDGQGSGGGRSRRSFSLELEAGAAHTLPTSRRPTLPTWPGTVPAGDLGCRGLWGQGHHSEGVTPSLT